MPPASSQQPTRRTRPWRLTLAVLFLAAILAGPWQVEAQAPRKDQPSWRRDERKTLVHDGIERSYIVHLPPGFDQAKAHPLVFNIHGGGGRADKVNKSTLRTFNREADRLGFVVVYPQGIANRWSDGRREIHSGPPDDVGFFDAMVEVMKREYGVDRKRIYATGISNGGFMSLRLALERATTFAAVAPVTAQIPTALANRRPDQVISLMLVNGTADPLVPYAGGHVRLTKGGRSRGEILSTDRTIEIFRAFNGCSESPVAREIPDRAKWDRCRAQIVTYPGCADGTEVVLVKLIGGGHTWPGGLQYLPRSLIGPVCRDLDASRTILDFFARQGR